ncbi:MAG: hypothetical protein ABIZ04_02620 [Opitutus sp.]
MKKLLSVAEGEWEGLILGGLYTGQRLGDLSSLLGRKIDLAEEVLTFRSQKTGRDMVIPLAKPFLDYLKKLSPLAPDAPVSPKAHAERGERTASHGACRLSSIPCSSKRNW